MRRNGCDVSIEVIGASSPVRSLKFGAGTTPAANANIAFAAAVS
jgi:hypothetical protein